MRTLILCGGKGTRAYPQTRTVPKPLMEVAGRPVVHHVMEIYATQGFDDFVLAAGHLHEAVEAFARGLRAPWRVEVIDTGEDTNTAARVAACRDVLPETFFATYADGLGDVDLAALLSFHQGHAGSATLTTVPLPSPYGTVQSNGSARVERFTEKPRLADHLINAGFFVLDHAAFEHFSGDDLERAVLPSLAVAGELYAFRHDGFWRSMDTYKDACELSACCEGGRAPWLSSTAHVRS